jgi:hypothetical protein
MLNFLYFEKFRPNKIYGLLGAQKLAIFFFLSRTVLKFILKKFGIFLNFSGITYDPKQNLWGLVSPWMKYGNLKHYYVKSDGVNWDLGKKVQVCPFLLPFLPFLSFLSSLPPITRCFPS